MSESLLGVEHSVAGQKWQLRADDDARIEAFVRDTGLDELTARLLVGRDVSATDVEAFLSPTLRDLMPDPSSLADMDKAADLIVEAVEAGKKITVFADYDVDGGTSAAQLIRWGRSMGAEFGLYVPDRIKEGYGPSVDAFRQLKAEGNELIITVDCGAAAHEPLREAQSLDLPIVVIDHHLMHGEMPPCAALVNPNRADDHSGLGHLAAAGVTFMTLAALNREARRRGLDTPLNLFDVLSLTALGTVCDVVPLTGLNRAFVSQGLKLVEKGNIVGLAALSDVAGAKAPFTTYEAGFVLGPRINAGGRIGRAGMGAEMLSTENAQTAYAHAAELDRVNTERKHLQDDILREATEAITEPDDVIVRAMNGWHPGIIGIVAGRLKDRFQRPTFVIGIDDEGIGKGSGRSVKGVNLGDAVVAAKEAGLLIAGGGHAMAAGLTVEAGKIEPLRAFLNERLAEDVKAARQAMGLKIDALISPRAANDSFIEQIESIGPYGAGNPQPVFALPDLRIAYAQRLKGGHVRCTFEGSDGARISGICFRAEESGLDDILLSPQATRVHVAGRLKKDEWNGRTKIDLIVSDIALAEKS